LLTASIAMLACVQDCLTPWSTTEYLEKRPLFVKILCANECMFDVVQGIRALELTSLVFGIALCLPSQTQHQGQSWDETNLA